RIDDKTIDAVSKVLRSGWITTGPQTKLFEERLTKYCGNKKTICVSSATDGLELMLRWYGVGPGDEVIVPAYTYCSSANVIVHVGAKPVMVDINSDLNVNIANIKAAITDKTKVIIPVDIAGLPCDYSGLNELIKDSEVNKMFRPHSENQAKLGRILILSDAAHAFGAEYLGKKAGSLTDISVFSFHAVKNLTTAEGGAIMLNLPEEFDHEEIYAYLNAMSLHGQSKDALAKSKLGGWKYDVIHAGFKCNMTDIQAAIGLTELHRYDTETLPRRRAICQTYHKYFGQFQWAELPILENENLESSYHLFLLRIKGIDEQTRDQIIEAIYEQNVAVNVHFQPLPLLTAYREMGYLIDDYPNAYSNYSRLISLPVYYQLSDDDLATVTGVVAQAVEQFIKA
ncbi:MAG: DegT/DnrJ/EryC1/StrS aminotransferase family protein, partial [Flavobacteriales bacterium]|nr:DegT/DnrJ/EryC1/StrS aminotransferase family protein [Flavobacteriales bacterium]